LKEKGLHFLLVKFHLFLFDSSTEELLAADFQGIFSQKGQAHDMNPDIVWIDSYTINYKDVLHIHYKSCMAIGIMAFE